MTCLLFCEHLDTLLEEGNVSGIYMFFEILKNLVTSSSSFSSSFSVKVVFKSFFS